MPDLYPLAAALIRLLPPEAAHGATLWALEHRLVRPSRQGKLPSLATKVLGLDFPNPVGLAAGFDKNARVVDAALKLGFGFLEIGGLTPLPQRGNPRPRLFRLAQDEAVINRLGLNNDGVERARERLGAQAGARTLGPIGANVAANSKSDDPAADYVACLTRLAGLVDYVTVNVSSPNTPGLRELQACEALSRLLDKIVEARETLGKQEAKRLPILVKIAPDLSERELADIVDVALDRGADGLVVSNTTTAHRGDLKSGRGSEPGGLSGKPLFAPSTLLLKDAYLLSGGRLALIGVGGIASGADAYAKIRAGASLVQLYTALIYHGPRLVERIKADLAALLAADGFAQVADAVGADLKK